MKERMTACNQIKLKQQKDKNSCALQELVIQKFGEKIKTSRVQTRKSLPYFISTFSIANEYMTTNGFSRSIKRTTFSKNLSNPDRSPVVCEIPLDVNVRVHANFIYKSHEIREVPHNGPLDTLYQVIASVNWFFYHYLQVIDLLRWDISIWILRPKKINLFSAGFRLKGF